jgi:hypothetical protein
VDASEKLLPAVILERADTRTGELAWRLSDIPAVIEAARSANLLSLGGDLQVRAPSGLWGEPVGVGVDIEIADDQPWSMRVEKAAEAALAKFLALESTCDLEAIARDAFPTLLAEVGDAKEAIFFSWLVLSESEASSLKTS